MFALFSAHYLPFFLRILAASVLCLGLGACAGLKNTELAAGEAPVYAAALENSPPLYDSSGELESDRPQLRSALALGAPAGLRSSVRTQIQYVLGNREPYRIGAGDSVQVSIQALGEAQATEHEATVDAEGVIDLQNLGAYRIAGLSSKHAARVIAAGLVSDTGTPLTQVRVTKYQSQFITLSGQIYAPGRYAIDDIPMSLAEAITRAGSLLANADLNNIGLTRNNQLLRLNLSSLYENGIGPQEIMLRNGDALYFSANQPTTD